MCDFEMEPFLVIYVIELRHKLDKRVTEALLPARAQSEVLRFDFTLIQEYVSGFKMFLNSIID